MSLDNIKTYRFDVPLNTTDVVPADDEVFQVNNPSSITMTVQSAGSADFDINVLVSNTNNPGSFVPLLSHNFSASGSRHITPGHAYYKFTADENNSGALSITMTMRAI